MVLENEFERRNRRHQGESPVGGEGWTWREKGTSGQKKLLSERTPTPKKKKKKKNKKKRMTQATEGSDQGARYPETFGDHEHQKRKR